MEHYRWFTLLPAIVVVVSIVCTLLHHLCVSDTFHKALWEAFLDSFVLPSNLFGEVQALASDRNTSLQELLKCLMTGKSWSMKKLRRHRAWVEKQDAITKCRVTSKFAYVPTTWLLVCGNMAGTFALVSGYQPPNTSLVFCEGDKESGLLLL
jgi:hypothetical protein